MGPPPPPTPVDFDAAPSSQAPETITATRIERRFRYLGRDRRLHTITMRDLYTVDDATVNMGKAFLYSLITQLGYKRPDTKLRLKQQLSRTSLVY